MRIICAYSEWEKVGCRSGFFVCFMMGGQGSTCGKRGEASLVASFLQRTYAADAAAAGKTEQAAKKSATNIAVVNLRLIMAELPQAKAESEASVHG